MLSNKKHKRASKATSNQSLLTRPSASLVKRLAAFVYDAFIVISLILLATLIALIINKGESFSNYQLLFLSYLFVVVGGFITWFWKRSGQTLGMLSWKIKLVDLSGSPVSWPHAWVRFMIAIPSTWLFGIGMIWCLFDSDKQSLHDRLCKTRVILD